MANWPKWEIFEDCGRMLQVGFGEKAMPQLAVCWNVGSPARGMLGQRPCDVCEWRLSRFQEEGTKKYSHEGKRLSSMSMSKLFARLVHWWMFMVVFVIPPHWASCTCVHRNIYMISLVCKNHACGPLFRWLQSFRLILTRWRSKRWIWWLFSRT